MAKPGESKDKGKKVAGPGPITLEYGVPLDDTQVVRYFIQSRSSAEGWFEKIWKENGELYDVYWGETLSDVDKEFLARTKRPAISFNMARSTIDAIVGSDMADRKEVVFKPVGSEAIDNLRADFGTRLVRFMAMRRNVARQESDAFFDDLIGGYGFTETYLDMSSFPLSVPGDHVPQHEMYPDPDAVQDNLADARFFIRKKKWQIEEVQARWPDKAKSIQWQIDSGKIPGATPIAGSTSAFSSSYRVRQGVQIADVYDFVYYRLMPKVVWIDPQTGERKDTVRKEYETAQKALDKEYKAELAIYDTQVEALQQHVQDSASTGLPPAPVEQPQPPQPAEIQVVHEYSGRCYYRAYILGASKTPDGAMLLEHKELAVSSFPYTCVTGYKWKRKAEERVRFFGMMRVILDPQKSFNRALQTTMDILARSAKGGGFIEETALVGTLENFTESQAVPGMWHAVKDGAIAANQIKEKPLPQVSPGLAEFMRTSQQAFSLCSGVTDFVKGTASQERSNVLVSNLQTQSMTMLNPLMEPLNGFRVMAGRTRLEIILKHLPDEDINRIIGDVDPKGAIGILFTQDGKPLAKDGQTPYDPQQDVNGEGPLQPADIMRSTSPLDFDVVVDIGQASPNSRQALYGALEQGVAKTMLDAITQAGLDAGPMVMAMTRALPLPGEQANALADEMQTQWDQKQVAPPPEPPPEKIMVNINFKDMQPDAQAALLRSINIQGSTGPSPADMSQGQPQPQAPSAPPPGQ